MKIGDTKSAGKIEITYAMLKNTAYFSMLIDHIGIYILYRLYLCSMSPDEIGAMPLYIIMRTIGRISFPLFCVLIVEGMKKTGNRINYLLRMFILAIVSEPCFDYAQSFSLWDVSAQNVVWTLLIAGVMICLLERLNTIKVSYILKALLQILTLAICCGITYWLKTDYNVIGIMLVFALWMLDKVDGGYIKTKFNYSLGRPMHRLFYYSFYPVHLLMLGVVASNI